MATFTADSLYLQLFEVIFPNYDFAEVEPGQTPEDMASNIQGLLDLLGGQVLDMDLSFISAAKIVDGDLQNMQNFLQLLMDVVLLIAQKQAEEEEEEAESPEQDARDEMKLALGGESDAPSPDKDHDGSNKDETDTQKIANDMDLNDE